MYKLDQIIEKGTEGTEVPESNNHLSKMILSKIKLFFKKIFNVFNVFKWKMTHPEIVHLVITVFLILIGFLRTKTIFRIIILGEKLPFLFFIIRTIIIILWYLLFRILMKELQKRGYHKLAWIIAFQPLIDRVLLTFTGFSLIVLSHTFINKFIKK